MTPRLSLTPLTIKDANYYVHLHHRHHDPVDIARFAIGCKLDGQLVGAAIVGNPKARMLQDGLTAEVVRLVTNGTPHVCSKLYAACWRAWRAMGGERLITYILATESGTSLQAAGWSVVGQTQRYPRGWDRKSRPRKSLIPKAEEQKTLWEVKA